MQLLALFVKDVGGLNKKYRKNRVELCGLNRVRLALTLTV